MTRAHVITGRFGAGKTTAIGWLMSQKPRDELWVVILNEFTAVGLDALSVAQSAQGNYDVRLVAGGCMCCVGELEFGKQLRDILRNLRPARLLIEPSGAGHAADIVDELAIYAAQRALTLDSVICLIDPLDSDRILQTRPANEWSQIQSADVLLLSKADLSDHAARRSFDSIAAAQYPLKQFVGTCRDGVLPPEALRAYSRAGQFSQVHDAAAATAPNTTDFTIAGLCGSETQTRQLGLWAVGWTLPRELTFSRVVIEPRLQWLTAAFDGGVRRFKGVFRTGPPLKNSWTAGAPCCGMRRLPLEGRDSATMPRPTAASRTPAPRGDGAVPRVPLFWATVPAQHS